MQLGCGQHQRVTELYDLLDTLGIDDFNARQPRSSNIYVYLAGVTNEVVKTIKRDLDYIILRVIGDSKQRQPLGLDLAAQRQRINLYFRPFSYQRFRHIIEE